MLSVADLVAVGDHLIHWQSPLCTLDDLQAAIARYPGRRGRTVLTEAIGLLDDHSESPQESRLRVLLHSVGIVGLVANLRITVRGRRYRADLALPRWKVAIEYQSDYHRDADQWRKDMSKRESIATIGWHTMEMNADDLSLGRELGERVRGVVLRHQRAPEGIDLPPERMRAVSEAAVDGLAELHAVDYQAAGLGDFGRPAGYVSRQVNGWAERWKNARTDHARVPERTVSMSPNSP